MTTLAELRDLVHTQTQTTSGDLADSTIDWYLQQAYERTINGESQWPFFQQSWQIMLPAGEVAAPIPGDVNKNVVMALYDYASNYRLEYMNPQWMDDHFAGPTSASGQPIGWTIWGDNLYLYPRVTFSADREYRLRGYRRPGNWLTVNSEPDCDARLHLAFVHYAVALAYAQQEDEVLETSYMDRWLRDVEIARVQIMEPRHHRPLVMAMSADAGVARGASWVLVPPTP